MLHTFLIFTILIFSLNSFSEEDKIVHICHDENVNEAFPNIIKEFEKFYKELGFKTRSSFLPPKRAILYFEEKQCDALTIRIAQAQSLLPSAIIINEPILKDFQFGLWKKKSQKKVDLKNAKIVGIHGNFYAKYYSQAMSLSRIHFVKDVQMAFSLLENDRVHYVLAPKAAAMFTEKANQFEYVPELSMKGDLHHFISKKLLPYKPKIEAKIYNKVRFGSFSPSSLFKQKVK